MRISTLKFSVTENKSSGINNKQSLAFKGSMPEDKFISSTVISPDMATPELLLQKVRKSDKNAKGVNELFEAVISERAKAIDLIKKHEEREILRDELRFAYTTSPTIFLGKNAPQAQIDYLLRPVKRKISYINDCLAQYENLPEIDFDRLKLLGKIAKSLTKKTSFNPNYKGSDGLRFINRTLNSGDDELSLMLIRHKDFECPAFFINPSDEERCIELEKQSKPFFIRWFDLY